MRRRQVVFSRIVLIVLVISIIGLLVAAILGIGKNMLSSDEADTATPVVKEDKALLLTDIPNEKIEIVVRGPIVADENFRSYTISISQKERSMSVYSGYKKDPLQTTTIYNNSEAFTQLVYALERAKMADQVAEASDDTRGICATGDLVVFNIYKKGEKKKSLWTSTCNGSKGNLGLNNAGRLQKLFSEQIPNFDDMLVKTGLE